MRIQVYVDVLRSIHSIKRSGEPIRLYHIERLSGLTYPRLKKAIVDLEQAGFLEASLDITGRGYAFLEEITAKVAPVMAKCGFWQDHA